MSDDDDMMRQRRQLYAQGNVLSRRFHMCSLEVNNVLFRTFCTPLYTCQLWSRYTARSLHKLYVAYNNAFRMMHHLPTYCSASEMFTVNRVPNCAAVIRNLTFKFMSRLGLSSNALVLLAIGRTCACSKHRPICLLLFTLCVYKNYNNLCTHIINIHI